MATKAKYLKFGVVNVQSARNKTIEINELIKEKGIDILIMTETWLHKDRSDDSKINEMVPTTHEFINEPREQRGGGVGIIISRQFKYITKIERQTYKSFEHIEIKTRSMPTNKMFRIIAFYRNQNVNINVFLEEFGNYLNLLTNEDCQNLLLCGDFNIQINDRRNRSVDQFENILEEHNMSNIVTEATTRHGNILDLVICNNENKNNIRIWVEPESFLTSIHKLITFTWQIK